MVFVPAPCVPELGDVPDSITLEQFINDEKYGRHPSARSRNPYTCGITGKTFTCEEVKNRTTYMARAISKRLGFLPNEDTEWHKVACIYSLNTIDYIPLTHAIHRLSGIVTPASAAYSALELQHQLKSSNATALFTCAPLLENALKAAEGAGISRDRIFLLELPGASGGSGFVTVENLVSEGAKLPELDPLRWAKGQGARQVAYLCYSSGTSGLPKAVMVSHRNVIANSMQIRLIDRDPRKEIGIDSQVTMGLLPFSHIYALVVVTHVGTYRGDEIIVLPRFEFKTFLSSIQDYKINQVSVVPPIIINLIRNQAIASKYDLSSVRFLYTGAAPLGSETVTELLKQYPNWKVGQGYGMTETATGMVSTRENDILVGSSGNLLPGSRAKIIDFDGKEVTEYEKPGELYFQGPAVTLGYLNNEKATAETFVWDEDGRWIRTGDEVLVRLAPSGTEHFVIVDRIKELIKVKGHQVAPAELEAHLLTHPHVSDCTVIQVPDEMAGEVPKAFVVKSAAATGSDDEVARGIAKHVEDHKARYKWLKGGVEFIDVIPKSPSGKILRRLLRDKDKESRRAKGAKI
ncbi:probable phenylacetyl-CoA ligase [Cephalotrichum gorgonifer]|uniref:Probable phenylacetyl-CoA ligase n=1 Tax=Cephalotrichum gorgonifer TaxID=2041049 RepID=A0AAE8MVI1_9PEZI|nr:probable phenylacetyl-CoA ligase [Cephalotrichum gorgonifer]